MYTPSPRGRGGSFPSPVVIIKFALDSLVKVVHRFKDSRVLGGSEAMMHAYREN
jgi:hypothetical protein